MLNLLQWNPKIWDDVKLPPGVDLQLTVDTIAMEYGTCDVIHHYPDTFKWMNDAWFRRKYWCIEKMYKTLEFEYNPIENYRRHEDEWQKNNDKENKLLKGIRNKDRTETDDYNETEIIDDRGTSNENVDYASTKDNTGNLTKTGNVDRTLNKTVDFTGKTVTDTSTTATGEVSAYNSESFVNDNKASSTSDGTENKTDKTIGKDLENTDSSDTENEIKKEIVKDDTITNGSTTDNRNRTDESQRNIKGMENEDEEVTEDNSSDRDMKRGLLAYGNIGVTTTQQMIKEEREVSEFDFYRWLADMWAQDNVVLCSC